jgi:hypothetical protein
MSVSATLIRELQARGIAAETILDALLAVEDERRAKERARVAKYRNNNKDRTENTRTTRTPRTPRTPLSLETKAPPAPPLKTQSLSPKETPSIEGGKKTPKTRSRIVPDWHPNDENVGYAGKLGLLETDIRREAEKFRDHHLKTGTAFFDWNAAWRTWCQRVHEFAPKPAPNGTGPPKDKSVIALAAEGLRRLQGLPERGIENEQFTGPSIDLAAAKAVNS